MIYGKAFGLQKKDILRRRADAKFYFKMRRTEANFEQCFPTVDVRLSQTSLGALVTCKL